MLKVFSAFSGIGAIEQALKILRLQHEVVGFSEVDKFAIQTYSHNFPSHKNFGDITKIDAKKLPDFDLFVGGFPCQDFSIAGNREGFERARGTLFFDCARIIKEKRPKMILLENVKGLLSHNKGKTIGTILSILSEIGYAVDAKVLNSKNFGVPQNRERIFIVGKREDLIDIPGFWRFGYPKPTDNSKRLVDILEEKIDEKYFLTKKQAEKLLDSSYHSDRDRIKNKQDAGGTLTATNARHPACAILQLNKPKHSSNRVYSEIGLSPTLRAGIGGNAKGSVIVQINSPKHSNNRVYSPKGISPTLNTMQGGNRQPFIQNEVCTIDGNLRIRRLTPTECLRLQGFPDDWFPENLSNSQKYKQCGNTITVKVLIEILRNIKNNL